MKNNSAPEQRPAGANGSPDVLRRIIQYIKSGKLRPGTRLPAIRDFARMWKIKGGLVRDALLRAQTIGVVRLEPRAGAYVKSFDYSQLASLLADVTELAVQQTNPRQLYLYDARIVIEAETFRRAAGRHTPVDIHELQEKLLEIEKAKCRMEFVLADEQFHLCVARIGGNPILATVLEALLAMLRPDRTILKRPSRDLAMIQREHIRMFKAIAGEQPARAAKLAGCHIDATRQVLLDQINRELKLTTS